MSIFTENLEAQFTMETSATPLPDDAPFRLLLMGDFSGKRANLKRPIFIDRDNFEDVMRKLNVGLDLDLQGNGEDVIQLQFEELDDFHPDKLFHQVPLFQDLRGTRKRLMNDNTFETAAREVRSWLPSDAPKIETVESEPPLPSSGNLLDDILSGGGTAVPTRTPQPTSSSELNSLLSELVKPFLVKTDANEQAKLVAAVDNASGELMRKILHHPEFQALEAAWRGAYLVTSRVETDNNLKIYLLDVPKEELVADLKSAKDLHDSAFSRLLTEKITGMKDDDFYAAVCANYSFKSNVDDVATLMRIAEICKNSDTPFIAQADTQIIGLESLMSFSDTRILALSENTNEGKLWNMLRELDEAKYISLTIPRLMARLPYGKFSDPTENFKFEELSSENRHEQYCWMNSAFACGMLLAQTFSENEWEFGNNLQTEINGLPMYIYQNDSETFVKPGSEAVLTVTAANQIIDQGLTLFVSFRDSDKIRLARLQSISANSSTLKGKW
jgi:type VI secretion system protein ImpC